MPKAVEKPDDTKALLALEKQLEEPADLHRNGGGFTVSAIFLPDLKTPTEVQIDVKTGDGAKIDSFKVPVGEDNIDKVLDAFHHTTQHSEKLLAFLGGAKKG
jgi:hypothetical protein